MTRLAVRVVLILMLLAVLAWDIHLAWGHSLGQDLAAAAAAAVLAAPAAVVARGVYRARKDRRR